MLDLPASLPKPLPGGHQEDLKKKKKSPQRFTVFTSYLASSTGSSSLASSTGSSSLGAGGGDTGGGTGLAASPAPGISGAPAAAGLALIRLIIDMILREMGPVSQ